MARGTQHGIGLPRRLSNVVTIVALVALPIGVAHVVAAVVRASTAGAVVTVVHATLGALAALPGALLVRRRFGGVGVSEIIAALREAAVIIGLPLVILLLAGLGLSFLADAPYGPTSHAAASAALGIVCLVPPSLYAWARLSIHSPWLSEISPALWLARRRERRRAVPSRGGRALVVVGVTPETDAAIVQAAEALLERRWRVVLGVLAHHEDWHPALKGRLGRRGSTYGREADVLESSFDAMFSVVTLAGRLAFYRVGRVTVLARDAGDGAAVAARLREAGYAVTLAERA